MGSGEACVRVLLSQSTYEWTSNCDSVTYCALNNTCLLRGCGRDVFPFGYPQDSNFLPPLCKSGTFCPDEMDACQPLLRVDSLCQLNRDGASGMSRAV